MSALASSRVALVKNVEHHNGCPSTEIKTKRELELLDLAFVGPEFRFPCRPTDVKDLRDTLEQLKGDAPALKRFVQEKTEVIQNLRSVSSVLSFSWFPNI